MPTASLAPFFKQRYFDANGNPLVGGKLFTYQSGTTTPQATYTSAAAVTANANPVILDANGQAGIWLDISLSYKVVLKDSSDVTQWTEDGIVGLTTNNSVSTAALQDLSVTTAKLANSAVTSAKLASDAVVDANRPVGTNNIKDGSITPVKLSASSAESNTVRNHGISASVSLNALTIALKTKALTDASASDSITASFRDSSASSGTYSLRTISSALSIIVPSSTTLGTVSATAEYLYVYLLDNAGVSELAVSVSAIVDEGSLVSTSAISGGATRGTLYSTVARTSLPVRLIGRIRSTQTTAGTWAAGASEVSLIPIAGVEPVYAKFSCSTTGVTVGTTQSLNYDKRIRDSHNAVTAAAAGTGTWKFTAPVSGNYEVKASAYLAATKVMQIFKNGTGDSYFQLFTAAQPCMGSVTIFLSVGDYIDVRCTSGSTTVSVTDEFASWVSVFKVGNN